MAGTKHSARKMAALSQRLNSILCRVSDAKAVIETGVGSMMDRGEITPAVVTAQQGLGMLHEAFDELDAAIGQLAR